MPSPYPWHYNLRWPFYYRYPSIKQHIHLSKMPLKINCPRSNDKNFLKLLFCGDIMVMQGDVIPILHDKICQLISSADILIGNCEAPVGYHKRNPNAHYKFNFFMPSEYLAAIIKQTNLPASKWYLSTANNHTGDVNYQATLDNFQILKDMKITPLGRWQSNILPLTIFELKNVRFGIIAWTDWMNCEIFPENDPGAFRRKHIENIDWLSVKKQLYLNRLIAFPHWEYEFQHYPHLSSQFFAKKLLLNQGVDLLVGVHTHTLQPVENFGNKLCFYNLGNFCGLGIAWPVRMVPLLEIYFDLCTGNFSGYHLHIFAQVNSDNRVDILPLTLAPAKLQLNIINRLNLLYEGNPIEI